jgi:hypothetical protein
MDIQKFTERCQGFLQAASTIAIREFHQRITPEHLLKPASRSLRRNWCGRWMPRSRPPPERAMNM